MDIELINYEGALDRLGGDREFLAELLEEMIKQVDMQFQALNEAVEKLDYKKLHQTAHGLKGASANLDITRLFHLFKELEKQGADENIHGAQEILENIASSKKELRTFVDTL